MKRGLVEWDAAEVPRSALEARARTARAWGREHGFDALLLHVSDTHPQPVRNLTHFVMYWNEGVVLLPTVEGGDAEPLLVYGLSGRVLDWVQRTSTLTQAQTARDVGAAVAGALAERGLKRVGLVQREAFPIGVLYPIAQSGDVQLEDARGALDALLTAAAEEEDRLRRRGGVLLFTALEEVARAVGRQTRRAVAAGFHQAVRLQGAEDLVFLADGPGAWPRLPDASHFAAGDHVLARVEYKGAWCQAARTMLEPQPAWFGRLADRVRAGATVGEVRAAGAELALAWVRVEPLSGVRAFVQAASDERLRVGSAVSVTALDRERRVLWGETLLVRADGPPEVITRVS